LLRYKILRFIVPLVLLSTAIGLAVAQRQPSANENFTVVWKPPAGNPQDFVGEQVCLDCHVAEGDQFNKTVHAKAAPANAKYGTGCESCHGPGKAHAEGMMNSEGDDAKIAAAKLLIYGFHGSPSENSARCMSCHITSLDQSHFDQSEHHFNGVGCVTCHAPHLLEAADMPHPVKAPVTQQAFFTVPRLNEQARWLSSNLLRQSQPDLCFSCHGVVQAQFALPSHHRVPEGLMKCTDCHSPHGTRNKPMLRKTNWEICVNCHIEKRGPFVFEHAAVKVEGCIACHSPHGTVTRMLLLRREGRFLCLQCHVDPQAPNVPHGRLSFATMGECVRCHVNIHGSNFNEFFLN
jgi:predicted CXXCH cytochrome family protein